MRFLTTLRNLFQKYRFWLIIIAITIPAIYDLLLPGYFSMHDDLQQLRLAGMHQCVVDLQLPCRWIPDAGFGLGYPMFNYYPPLPFYLGEVFHLLGFDLFWSMKLVFIAAFVLSGIFMYKLTKPLFGELGAVISTAFYIYAPYHSVDIYVRGALNEAFGLVWFPLIFHAAHQIIVNKQKTKSAFILLALSYAGLLLSHNVMTLIFTPLLGLWCFYWLFISKNFAALKSLLLSGFLAIGLAAFFFIPVAVETKMVHVETMTVGYFNYLAHYADLNQMLISRFWGYGGSTWGPEDSMAFPIGHFHWILGSIIGAVCLTFFFKSLFTKKINSLVFKYSFGILLLLAVTGFYVFLIHSRSIWFWDNLPLLYYAQFPWRLLAIPTFTFSFLAGLSALAIKKLPANPQAFIIAILISSLIAWNLPFFKIEKPINQTIQEKFSGYLWELQTTGGIFDYLPKTAARPPGAPGELFPVFITGTGGVMDFSKNSNSLRFTVTTQTEATLQLPTYDFPRWKFFIDGKLTNHTHEPDLGRVQITVPSGTHQITGKLYNTPIRLISNLISLLSFAYLIYLARKK